MITCLSMSALLFAGVGLAWAAAWDERLALLFGWMGSGFHVPAPERPCHVHSKALELTGTETGRERVIDSDCEPF